MDRSRAAKVGKAAVLSGLLRPSSYFTEWPGLPTSEETLGQIEVLGGRDPQALGHFLEPSFCNGNASNTCFFVIKEVWTCIRYRK